MANRYSDNRVDHLTVKSVDNNNTNSDNIQSSTTQYHPNISKPHGYYYAVDHGTKHGSTYHMNVVNENCVYEPTGYSKKILDFKTEPCNSELISTQEIADYDRSTYLRPEYLDLVKLPKSDSSSQSESNNSSEDEHTRINYEPSVDSQYVRGQDKLASGIVIGSSPEKLIYDYSSLDFGVEDPIWSIDSERRYKTSGYLEPISERLSSSYNSSRSFSPRCDSDFRQDDSVVNEKTKPYIDMTNRVRESAGTPSSFNVFDNNKSRIISPNSRQSSFTKSQPSSPMVYKMPPRAFSARDSITSDRSSRLDPHTYQSYAAGILYSTGKSEQFLKLQKHFAVLERISDIEVKTKDPKFGTLPRTRFKTSITDSVDSQYDYDKDDELGYLYAELEEAQKKREFLYSVSDKNSVPWTPDKDTGLLKKEKSLGDLRSSYLNQDSNYCPKPAFTLETEDEFRREQEFLDLYDKYKYPDLVEEDLSSSLSLPYQDFKNNHSNNRYLYNDPVTADDDVANMDSVKKLSKSEPNINKIPLHHVNSLIKETHKPTSENLKNSDSPKQSNFGITKNASSFVKAEPNQLFDIKAPETFSKPPVDEPKLKPLTYTGSRINWSHMEANPLFSEEKTHPDTNDFADTFAKTTYVEESPSKNIARSEVSNTKTEPSVFVVKDLRSLAENNEFSLSKFAQMKRSKSCQEMKPIDKIVRKHKAPVPLPASQVNKERPPNPVSSHNLQISDPDYIFKYRDMGNAGASQERVTEIKKLAFPEKLELMQKLNDEKNRELEKSILVSSASVAHLASATHMESAESTSPWEETTNDNERYTTHSLPNRKRQVSGNSIFHKQAPRPFKAANNDDISEHPPAYSSIMTPRAKSPLITSPALSNQEPFASLPNHNTTHTNNTNPTGTLRRWQPQNLADLNSSISSNFVNSSTETFIVNSDEDLSASQTSSLVSKRRDNYQTNSSLEKSRSEPDLVITDYGPNRPRSAKSQVNVNQEDKKPNWRRTIGVEYVNEPIEAHLPRTISGDFEDVRKKWNDGKWNSFGRSQSSESPTSLDNYNTNESADVETENLRNSRYIPSNNRDLYEDTKKSMIIKTPSKYNYEPYLPPSDIVNEVTKVTEGRKLMQPKPKNRTPSSVSRLTLEYFDQLGGEWKYGNKRSLNSNNEPSNVKNLNPISLVKPNTNEIYSQSHTVPIVSSYVNDTSQSPNGFHDSHSQYNSLPNTRRYEEREKPVPTRRSGKPIPNHQYVNGNITDQDKLLHTSANMPKPILRNSNKNHIDNQEMNGSSSNKIPLSSPKTAISSPKLVSRTASSSRIPPPPTRKVPPAPRSTTSSHASSRSDHQYHHHSHHQATNLPTANNTGTNNYFTITHHTVQYTML
ncbi:hypothetical protein LOTGIDRAFT_154105 [Lottia gigantea]|uniref:Uncharacterized protein n=1 Tax=Lottia gigantea TaxID=225164 RepID=V4A272_LOTGI|nr:hypothetical protein LOTGIDRAFT_154105 [Lottia gigantea]ESO89030.1 hypothetical protein LOTGIDRAFT_154105 [Lottia gigantea]